jgi:Ala-tRNA(Pro) deacylase
LIDRHFAFDQFAPEPVMRVSQFLQDQHADFETLTHAPAYTAQKRARFLHISGRKVVKSVLLSSGGRFVLAVLPAADHVDLDAVALELGAATHLAGEREMMEVFRDCEHGALAPFGSLYGIATILEDGIDPETMIVFESQQHALTIKMRCRDFEGLERPRRFGFRQSERA